MCLSPFDSPHNGLLMSSGLRLSLRLTSLNPSLAFSWVGRRTRLRTKAYSRLIVCCRSPPPIKARQSIVSTQGFTHKRPWRNLIEDMLGGGGAFFPLFVCAHVISVVMSQQIHISLHPPHHHHHPLLSCVSFLSPQRWECARSPSLQRPSLPFSLLASLELKATLCL